MPELIAAAAVYAGATATAAAVIGYTTTVVAGLAFSRYNQRKAARLQSESLQDRTTPVRQSDAARVLVYGRTRVSGPIVYHKTHGDKNQDVSHVIPLAGHEITAVDDVWFNDTSITPWTGGPVTSGSPYYVDNQTPEVFRFTGNTVGNTFTLPLNGGTLVAVDTITYRTVQISTSGIGDSGTIYVDGGTDVRMVEGVDYSMSSNVGTLLNSVTDDLEVTVTYRVNRGIAYARVYPFLGIAAGERDTNLETWSDGEWTSDAVGKGVARLHVVTSWNETLYATGFPAVSAIVRGKRVYDPRLDSTNGGSGSHRADTASTWAYSDNPALCAADYLRDALGFGCTSSEIDWASVAAAANVCDELVPIDGVGGEQKRYALAGVLSTETDRKTNLESILDSMVGIAVYSGGKWVLRAGAYETPTLDMDDTDLAGGDVTVQARANRRDLFNAVRGRYRAPDQLYQVTDFPPYASSTYATEDAGEVLYREIDLPMVDDARRAQRIAKLILFRARQALTMRATFKLSAYALQPGDTCRLTISRYGWTNKVFRVLRREFASLQTVTLTLQEDASSIYSWAYSEAVDPDPAPNTALPDPRYVAIPAGVVLTSNADTFYVRQDGVIVPYVSVDWTLPTADDVHVEVFWKRAGEAEYRRVVAPVGATYAWLEGVAPGELLNVYLVAVNAIGARSPIAWIPSYTVSEGSQSGRAATSSNRVKNATFDGGVGSWDSYEIGIAAGSTAILKPSAANGYPSGFVPGTPSNALLRIASSATGDGYAGVARCAEMQCTPGARFAAFASLLGWGTDCYIAIAWYDGASSTPIGLESSGSVSGVPVNSTVRVWRRAEDHSLAAIFAVAPAGARIARLLVYGSGNWTAGPFKYVSILRPFFGEIPLGVTQLPPWDAGGANMITTPLLATTAATQSAYIENAPGTSFNLPTLASIDYPLASLVAEADGDAEIVTTFEVHGEAAGGASTLTSGVYVSGKLQLVTRTVMELATNTGDTRSMTLSATYRALAGETIAPVLRISRTRFGLSSGNIVDVLSKVSSRVTLIKR